ncbi:MAG: DoxX family protein, partial [Actinomycetota bacterium]
AMVVGTRRAERHVDVALVVVRVALFWTFIHYGAGKLFGWFDGPGIHRSALFFANTAHLRPGGLFAVLGGVIELGGALALLFGVGTRLVGIALCGDMVMATITVTWSRGFYTAQVPPGYELNLALAVLALVLVLSGAGRFSADALLERRIAKLKG